MFISHNSYGRSVPTGVHVGAVQVTKLREHDECSIKPARGLGRTRIRRSGSDTRGNTARGATRHEGRRGDPGLSSSNARPRLPLLHASFLERVPPSALASLPGDLIGRGFSGSPFPSLGPTRARSRGVPKRSSPCSGTLGSPRVALCTFGAAWPRRLPLANAWCWLGFLQHNCMSCLAPLCLL